MHLAYVLYELKLTGCIHGDWLRNMIAVTLKHEIQWAVENISSLKLA